LTIAIENTLKARPIQFEKQSQYKSFVGVELPKMIGNCKKEAPPPEPPRNHSWGAGVALSCGSTFLLTLRKWCLANFSCGGLI